MDGGSSTLTIAGWSLLGGGALVAVVGGAVFGAMAADEKASFESESTNHWSDASRYRDNYTAYTSAEAALLAIGGAAAVAGAVLLVLEATSEEPAPAAVAPLANEGAVGVLVSGRF